MGNASRPGSGGFVQDPGLCGVCGGDGQIDPGWGQVARCPSCHGTGRRSEDAGFHDVTKTKESHYHTTTQGGVAEKQTWPSTPAGAQLATEVKGSTLTDDVKARLTREIIDHEATHGQCTKTFVRKVHKLLRPATAH